MAAKANCADDTYLGNDKEIAGLTNAYMGEIYYKSFHEEDTAIGYYEKALPANLKRQLKEKYVIVYIKYIQTGVMMRMLPNIKKDAAA